MSIQRIIGAVLVVVGAILLFNGLSATEAPMEEIGRELTGSYSDNTMTYIVAGAAALVAGGLLMVFGGRRV